MADFFQAEDEAPDQSDPESLAIHRFIKAYMDEHPSASPIAAIGAYQRAQRSTPEALKARIQQNLSKPICGMSVGAAIDPRSSWPSPADSGGVDPGLLASFPKLTAARRKEVGLMPHWGGGEAALYLLDREFPRSWDNQGMSAFNTIVRCPATCPEIADSLEWAERQGGARRSPQEWCRLWEEQGRAPLEAFKEICQKIDETNVELRELGLKEGQRPDARSDAFVRFMLSFRDEYPNIPNSWLVQLVLVEQAAQFLDGGYVQPSTRLAWLRRYYQDHDIDAAKWEGRPSETDVEALEKALGWLLPNGKAPPPLFSKQEQKKSLKKAGGKRKPNEQEG